uniref:Uncharacterized protein n=1 Tax=Quercus lobata TaxID=97700 RepID=A0A7N2R3G4_QUELO
MSSFCNFVFAVYVKNLFVSYGKFINKARPWITLMVVGWEYGANMLTKYLAEAGENTPLTAATCIDNPFDLEEATRSSPYHMAID